MFDRLHEYIVVNFSSNKKQVYTGRIFSRVTGRVTRWVVKIKI